MGPQPRGGHPSIPPSFPPPSRHRPQTIPLGPLQGPPPPPPRGWGLPRSPSRRKEGRSRRRRGPHPALRSGRLHPPFPTPDLLLLPKVRKPDRPPRSPWVRRLQRGVPSGARRAAARKSPGQQLRRAKRRWGSPGEAASPAAGGKFQRKKRGAALRPDPELRGALGHRRRRRFPFWPRLPEGDPAASRLGAAAGGFRGSFLLRLGARAAGGERGRYPQPCPVQAIASEPSSAWPRLAKARGGGAAVERSAAPGRGESCAKPNGKRAQ